MDPALKFAAAEVAAGDAPESKKKFRKKKS